MLLEIRMEVTFGDWEVTLVGVGGTFMPAGFCFTIWVLFPCVFLLLEKIN